MRCVLLGAVETTATALRTLCEIGCRPALVATIPPNRSSRHSDYRDVGAIARELGCEVVETIDGKDEAFVDRVRELRPDWLFVIGWSRIVPSAVLELPRRGAIGFHPAALPENRGRAVIPWTILRRQTHTGTSLFWIDGGIDSGDILAQQRFEVASDETAATLYEKHLQALTSMLERVIPLMRSGRAPREQQDHSRATYCARRTEGDGLIDWNHSAERIWTLVRAVSEPYPGAFTYRGLTRITLWDAELVGAGPYVGLAGQVQEVTPRGALIMCGDGELIHVGEVSERGGEKQSAASVLRRHERLGVDLTLIADTLGRNET